MLFARLAGCNAAGGFRLASLPPRWLPARHRPGAFVLPEFERLLALVPGGRRWWRRHRFSWPGLERLKERARAVLQAQGMATGEPFVVIHAGAKLALKRWMPDRFGWLARHVARTSDTKIVLTGAPGDRAVNTEVLRASGDGVCLDLTGKTAVGELTGVLALAEAAMANDTGAAHLAAAVGTPCLVLMSGRDHRRKWKPIGGNHVRLRAEVLCSPCHRNECASRRCLRKITVGEAAAAFDRLWRQREEHDQRERNTCESCTS
jgi:ADP-heptose:LPS heptosyltransferase